MPQLHITSIRACIFALVVMGGRALSQSDASADLHPLAETPVDAGVLDLASGTWRARVPGEGLAGTIYANTCPSAVFVDATAAGTVLVDEGRIPSTSSPSPRGDQNAYRVTDFTFAYATRAIDPGQGGPGAHVLIELFEGYAPCAPLISSEEPRARFELRDLPGAPAAGVLAAYVVTVELPGLETCLAADGDGQYDANPLSDGFGVSMRILGETNGPAGFLLAGPVPGGCAVGDGTRWQNPEGPGSGVSNFNFLRREGSSPGCISFGAQAWGGLFFALSSSIPGACSEPGNAYCYGLACPCANDDPHAGCRNGSNFGADLRGYGSTSVGADDLVLTAAGLPPNVFSVFIMAPGQQTAPFGGGLLCIQPGPPQSGDIGDGYFRFGALAPASASGIRQLGPGIAALAQGAIGLGVTRYFQCWYRNTGVGCGQTFNLSNAYSVTFVE